MEVLPASGGTQRFGVLAQRLRAGKIVCLICDRDVTGGGIEVEFFGEKARMMGGPAALAAQTGAALMPAILWFEGGDWGVHVHEEIPVPADGDSRQQAAERPATQPALKGTDHVDGVATGLLGRL